MAHERRRVGRDRAPRRDGVAAPHLEPGGVVHPAHAPVAVRVAGDRDPHARAGDRAAVALRRRVQPHRDHPVTRERERARAAQRDLRVGRGRERAARLGAREERGERAERARALHRHGRVGVDCERRRRVHEHAGPGERRGPDADEGVIEARRRVRAPAELAEEHGLPVPRGVADGADERLRERVHVVHVGAVAVPLHDLAPAALPPRPLVALDVPVQADRAHRHGVPVRIEGAPGPGEVARPRDPGGLRDGAVPLRLVQEIHFREERGRRRPSGRARSAAAAAPRRAPADPRRSPPAPARDRRGPRRTGSPPGPSMRRRG